MINDTAPGLSRSDALAIQLLRYALLLVAMVGIIAGPAVWLDGLRQPITQQAMLREAVPITLPDAAREGTTAKVPVDGVATFSLPRTAAREDVGVGTSTRLLWRSGDVLLGLSIGLSCWLGSRVVRDIARGRPFVHPNARRIAVIGVVIMAGGLFSQLLDWMGVIAALGDAGLDGPDSPFLLGGTLSLVPMLVAVPVLVIAEAFRQGTRISRDVEGLV
jgi:hypothetical protein